MPLLKTLRAAAPRGAVGNNVLSRLWRVPDSRKLLAAHIFLLAVCVAELFLGLLKPCLISSQLYSAECADTTYWLYMLVVPIKGLVGGGVLAHLGGSHNSFAAKSQLGLTKRNPEKYRYVSGWAAACTEDVFGGIVQVTKSTITWLVLSVALAIALAAAAFLASDLSSAASEEYQEYCAETCSQPDVWWPAFCWFAWKFKGFQVVCVMNAHTLTSILPLLLRKEMCTSIFVDALKRQNIRWLQRCLWMHWTALPPAPFMVAVLVIGLRISVRRASAVEMSVFTLIAATALVYIAAVLAWAFDLDGAVLMVWKRCLGHSGKISSVPDSSRDDCVESLGSLPVVDPEQGSGPPKQRIKIFSAESSFKHKQIQLLATTLILTIATPVASWLAVASIWVVRVLLFMLVLNTDEKSSTMKDLEKGHAAFGLLVDAEHLRKAIASHLEGREYTGPLKRTMATYYRMDDTLTISYRWNSEEVRICSGLRLNMNRWQLEELSRAIKESCCLYVWIDRLALPQQTCKLQTTLLARMMPIYATSKMTLALRTCASSGDRYHQRAWTLQEFCNAANLSVVTQPDLESSVGPACASAVANDEEELFTSVREWHRSRSHGCRPYWLDGFSPAQGSREVQEAMDWYKRLGPRLICLHPADKIRALYPMLFNTPCEDQAELVALVADVAAYEHTGQNWASVSSDNIMNEDEEIMANLPLGGVMKSTLSGLGDRSRRG